VTVSDKLTPRYATVVADPPWEYKNKADTAFPSELVADGSRRSLGASSHVRYGSMSMADLHAMPVRDAVADDAHLYLWTTNQFICEAHDLARSWGFVPKTVLTWGKVQESGEPSRKMGNWYRSASEHCLFAVRGRLRLIDPDPAPSTLFLHRRLPHSVKPEAFYDMVERYSPGPRIELFSRRARFGWDTWGNQALQGTELVCTSPPPTDA
jgi:N6-adenosine-specific RNA methylase IME4